MAVITISRQYGSGGIEIAEKLCKMLGYSLFDKNLMVEVAAHIGGFNQDQILDFSEDTYRMRSFVERLLGSRRVKVEMEENQDGEQAMRIASLDEEQGVSLVRRSILAAYERGNVVIIGRGGQAILREHPGVLHVRIDAPLGARALRIKERTGLSLGEASDLASRKDLARANYLRRFFTIEWDNPLLYHLIINTGKLDIDAATQTIITAMSHLPSIVLGLVED